MSTWTYISRLEGRWITFTTKWKGGGASLLGNQPSIFWELSSSAKTHQKNPSIQVAQLRITWLFGADRFALHSTNFWPLPQVTNTGESFDPAHWISQTGSSSHVLVQPKPALEFWTSFLSWVVIDRRPTIFPSPELVGGFNPLWRIWSSRTLVQNREANCLSLDQPENVGYSRMFHFLATKLKPVSFGEWSPIGLVYVCNF